MLEAANARPRFTISLKRSTRNLQLSTSRRPITPSLQILGTPDDLKFQSCLTLFGQAASNDTDRSLFNEALAQFYEGKPDPRTEQLLVLKQ